MILMNDFSREPEALIQEQLANVERVIRSGWYILGKEVEAFESQWATYCQAKHAIGVANGMDAIEIGLRCLNISMGDEVITTPMTAFATVLAIFRAGGTPVLADINLDTGALDPESVRQCITSKTKVILPVHLYGRPGPIAELKSLCEKHNIILAEDCAQAHGAALSGTKVGNFGAFGAWSFYPTKNLGTLGDGGCITTNDDNIAARARVIRNYGQNKRYFHSELGLNSRLDEIHAAILAARLKYLDSFTSAREKVALFYFENIANTRVELLVRPTPSEKAVHHLFPLKVQDRSEFMQHLEANQIQALIHYPVPAHLQSPCAHIRTAPAGLSKVEHFANCIVSIPCHPFLSQEELEKIVRVINEF